MKYYFAVLLLVASGTVLAKDAQPVSVGKGRYMLTDQNVTIFGSSDGIITKLMTRANAFCRDKTGSEAELVDSSGSNAAPGQMNNSGVLRKPAKGASGTIYFTCAAEVAKTTPTPASSPAPLQQDIYTELPKLKALLDSGAITQQEYDAQKKKLLGN